MSTNYRLIGSGKTDANGVAHITKDAEGQTLANPGYVGVGAGEIDVVASVDNPVISGSVVSQPYTVWDCVFLDNATENNHNDTGWTASNITTPLQKTDYKELKWNGTSTSGLYYRSFTDSADLCIEFDLYFIKQYGSSQIFMVQDNWTNLGFITKNNSSLAEETWHTVKIEMKNGSGTVALNGSVVPSLNFTSTGADRFTFNCNGANDVIQFKNFKVYPI